MTQTNINIRVDKEVKTSAERIFDELGLNMTTAINMFLKQSIRERALPFHPHLDIPNDITRAAMEEGERILNDPNAVRYDNVDELMKALLDE